MESSPILQPAPPANLGSPATAATEVTPAETQPAIDLRKVDYARAALFGVLVTARFLGTPFRTSEVLQRLLRAAGLMFLLAPEGLPHSRPQTLRRSCSTRTGEPDLAWEMPPPAMA